MNKIENNQNIEEELWSKISDFPDYNKPKIEEYWLGNVLKILDSEKKKQTSKADKLKLLLMDEKWEKFIEKKMDDFLLKIKNGKDFIDFSNFKKIWDWGTHDIYMSNDNRFVVKINRKVLDIARENNNNGILKSEIKSQANDWIEWYNNWYKSLYENFNTENCLYEKAILQKINIDDNMIECPIIVQEATDLFKKQTIDFGTEYIQDIKQEDMRNFEVLNTSVLWTKTELFNENLLIKFSGKIGNILSLVNKDDKFWYKVRDFLLLFKSFYEKEGKFIDLVGEKNVMFYKENDVWKFKLGSVIKWQSKDNMKDALWMLDRSPEELMENKVLKNDLNNTLTLIRMVNGLWIKLGLGKIIDISLNDNQIKNLNKMKL